MATGRPREEVVGRHVLCTGGFAQEGAPQAHPPLELVGPGSQQDPEVSEQEKHMVNTGISSINHDLYFSFNSNERLNSIQGFFFFDVTLIILISLKSYWSVLNENSDDLNSSLKKFFFHILHLSNNFSFTFCEVREKILW